MNKIKKLFGNINLSYKIVVISAIIIGALTGLLNSVPMLKDTSITDIAVYYDFWILCGIFIIMNSKSNKDAALKCFLFFLISQPLIYLVEVPFSRLGFGLFIYYKFWFIMTVLCLPMGFIGYYLKKDKWYGLIILTPIITLLTYNLESVIQGARYAFPHHVVSIIFILLTAIIYPLYIFKDKKIKYIGLLISTVLILFFCNRALKNDFHYSTSIKCSSDSLYFDDTYKVYLKDKNLGKVNLEYYAEFDAYCINAEFFKPGETKITLEDKDGNKKNYDLKIGKNTYTLNMK